MKSRHYAILIVLLALIVPAAMAGDGGFFIDVEGKYFRPTGLGTDYVLVSEDDDSDPMGEYKSVDFSRTFSPKITIGVGRDKGSGWSLSYWTYNEDERSQVQGYLWDVLAHADDSYDDYEGGASSFLDVEAKVMDFTYWRTAVEKDDLTLVWYAGLRNLEFETQQDTGYVYDLDDPDDVYVVTNRSTADGLGLIAGLRGVVPFGETWRLESSVGFSFIQGDVVTTHIEIDDGDSAPWVDVTREEERAMNTFDLSCRIVWQPSAKFSLHLGYELSQWNNVHDTGYFPDDVAEGLFRVETDNVSWDGVTFGATFGF